MEIYKIICSVIYLITTNIVYAESLLKMDDAIALFKKNNIELRHGHERALLLEEKSAIDNSYLPEIRPLSLSYNPDDKSTKFDTGAEILLPTGGTLNIQYHHTLNSIDENGSYQISFEQPFTHNTKLQHRSITQLETQLSKLHEQLKNENHMMEFKKLYRQCVGEQLTLIHKRAQLEQLKNSIKAYDIKYKHGEIAKIEYVKQIAAIENQALEMIKFEQTAELNLIKLKQKIGLNVNAAVRLDSEIQFLDLEINPQESIQLALQYSTQYKIYHLKHKIAELKYTANKRKQLPKLSVHGSVNQDGETHAGIKLSYHVPAAKVAYEDAKYLLQHMQEKESAQQEDIRFKTDLHQLLISLKHHKSIIALAESHLQNQQKIYEAAYIKFKYHEISAEEFKEASLTLDSAFNDAISSQIQYSNLYDNYLQTTGQLHLIHNALGGIQ